MNFESVHNYFEHLVYDEILQNREKYRLGSDTQLLEDVACVALNRLPTKYVRYDIDLAFYLTSEERTTLESSVRDAVKSAAEYVLARGSDRESGDPN